MKTKSDTRTLCKIPDSELDDLLYGYAVTQHGHASVKSFCNDLKLWQGTLEDALGVYGETRKTKHTQGPWALDEAGFVEVDNMTQCLNEDKGTPREWAAIGIEDEDGFAESVAYCHPANAARIVACVNACEGINPEAVPEMLEALKACVVALDLHGQFVDDIDAREAAEEFASRPARAAIAKAEGRDA